MTHKDLRRIVKLVERHHDIGSTIFFCGAVALDIFKHRADREIIEKQNKQLTYLANIINKNSEHIQIDQFDMIALKELDLLPTPD